MKPGHVKRVIKALRGLAGAAHGGTAPAPIAADVIGSTAIASAGSSCLVVTSKTNGSDSTLSNEDIARKTNFDDNDEPVPTTFGRPLATGRVIDSVLLSDDHSAVTSAAASADEDGRESKGPFFVDSSHASGLIATSSPHHDVCDFGTVATVGASSRRTGRRSVPQRMGGGGSRVAQGLSPCSWAFISSDQGAVADLQTEEHPVSGKCAAQRGHFFLFRRSSVFFITLALSTLWSSCMAACRSPPAPPSRLLFSSMRKKLHARE